MESFDEDHEVIGQALSRRESDEAPKHTQIEDRCIERETER